MAADTYYGSVSLLLPCNGTNNGTLFTDYSGLLLRATATGNAKTSTTQYKYYDSSGYFDGNGDYLAIAANSAFDQTGDFTVEAWVRPGAIGSQMQIFGANSSTNFLQLQISSAGKATVNRAGSTDVVTGTTTLSTNTWYHLAFCKSGSTTTLYVDGTAEGTPYSYSGAANSAALAVGGGTNSSYYFNGYIQDVRITKAARYSGNFTAPGKLIGYRLSGTTRDANGNPAAQTVSAHCRLGPRQTAVTTSDGSTGAYSFSNLVETEHFIVCQDDAAGDDFNDLILRATPA